MPRIQHDALSDRLIFELGVFRNAAVLLKLDPREVFAAIAPQLGAHRGTVRLSFMPYNDASNDGLIVRVTAATPRSN